MATAYDKEGALQGAKVMHARHAPTLHEFSYDLSFHILPLDNLGDASASLAWGYNRSRLFSVFDDDYLQRGAGSIKSKLLDLLRERGHSEPISRLIMVTAPRYLGIRVFNPVSFYFCYGVREELQYLAVEINNTFYERFVYVIECQADADGWYRANHHKCFHVSPFFGLDYEYRFRFRDIRDKLDISIDLRRDEKTAFSSRVFARRSPVRLTSPAYVKEVLSAPLAPLLTSARIYLQALQLFFRKRLPVIEKPAPSLPGTVRAEPVSLVDRACLWFVRRFLRRISKGAIELVFPDGTREVFGAPATGSSARMHIRNFRTFRRIVGSGGLGLGEGYLEGDWESPDLPAALKVLLNNWHAIDDGKLHLGKLLRLLHLLGHALRKNTVGGSRRNIEAHYDLSNDFFKLFLDESMTYGSSNRAG